MIVSFKCLPLTLAFLLLFSCSEPINPDAGDADHIFMTAGSVWDAGYEIELSKDGKNSSIFHHDVELEAPIGTGARAKLNDSKTLYQLTANALKPLESRAVLQADIDIDSPDFGMGFGCENQATDAMHIYVTWFYKKGIERHASFYTGCENPISAKIEKFVYDLQEKALKSTLNKSWRSSESRFGIDKQ
tara:strand:+ start:586 stop:1152 length:567 start_codon:yes stop_codon:yes gene_type:complete